MEILNIPIGHGHITQGDTISEILFEFESGADINLLAQGVDIKMQIYNNNVKIIDIAVTRGITILSETSFKIDEVPKDQNNLPFGSFMGDLQITDGEGKRFTYFRVKYTIEKQYTR